MKFKAEHTFEQRQAESQRVRAKYPDRIPGAHNFILSVHKIVFPLFLI